MVKSMTGYGRGEAELNGTVYTVELRSVNHRYFEFNCRAPKGLLFLEDPLKKLVGAKVQRGKVDVFIDQRAAEGEGGEVALNAGLAQSYFNALKQLKAQLHLPGKVCLSLMAANQNLFSLQQKPQKQEAVLAAVCTSAEQALSSFLFMRENEGARLQADVLNRCSTILTLVEQVEKRSPETVALYRERLQGRVRELLQDRQVEEQRLLTEIAIFADKIAVDEETVRLRSHIEQMRQLFEQSEPIGRKLDFLVQEMNREANTTGSKCVDLEITRTVVEIKSQIEKIREQIQNIE